MILEHFCISHIGGRLNHEDNFLFEIPCTLNVGDLPNITVTPTSITETITLGEVETITVPVTVNNTGTATGEYNATAVCTAGWLTLAGDTQGTVPAGANKTFNAVINPSELEPDDYEAVILVSTNDEAHPLFTITVKLKKEPNDINDFTIIKSVFPNPASDFVHVQCNKMINTVQVINNNGQIVYQTEVNDDAAAIDVSTLSAGYYFIRVITNEDTHSVKLIVR